MQLNILSIGTWSDESEFRIADLLLLEGIRFPAPGTGLGSNGGPGVVR